MQDYFRILYVSVSAAMGQTQAKNEIDSSISAMTSIVNSTVQKCAPTAAVSQVIEAITKGCKTSNIVIEHIDFSSMASIDVKCAQDAASTADVKTNIQQTAKQMAEAVSQSLNLNPGSTSAQNIARMSMNVATAVTNSTSQIIASAVATSQSIRVPIEGGDVCNIRIAFINMKSMVQSVADGVQKSTQVASAVTALKQAVDQEAKAKQSSLVMLIILAIIIAIAIMGGQTMKPLLYVGVPTVGGLYAWRLYLEKKYQKEQQQNSETFCCV